MFPRAEPEASAPASRPKEAEAPRTPPRVTVTLRGTADVEVRWEGPDGEVSFEGDLLGEDEEGKRMRERLHAALVELSDAWRDEDGTSSVTVLIEGSRDARWVAVQRLMQMLSASDVGIFKIQFRVTAGSAAAEDVSGRRPDEKAPAGDADTGPPAEAATAEVTR